LQVGNGGAVTVTLVLPELPSGNVPTTVSVPVPEGVYTPEALIEPVLPGATFQVTPVCGTPFRSNTHWLVWLDVMELGEHDGAGAGGVATPHALSQEVAPGVAVSAHWLEAHEK
jgi:hypothetical protein